MVRRSTISASHRPPNSHNFRNRNSDSGVAATYYRISLLDNDTYCDGINEDEGDFLDCDDAPAPRDSFFDVYTDIDLSIGEESCHLIEYYSVDNVDKTEEIKRQCVFVDDTGPDPIKTVGEPMDLWTPGENGDPISYFYPEETAHCWDETGESIDCWEVTTVTPILMDCEDPDPHPSGEKGLCYNVEMDGEDITKKYCREYGGRYHRRGSEYMDTGSMCCIRFGPEDEVPDYDVDCEDFPYNDECDETQDIECYQGRKKLYFLEETEHNLKYYCKDKLKNKGPIDEEKFKVEGTNFEIPLYKKWNLISVPFTLLNDDPEVVFGKIFYDGEQIPVEEISDYIDSVWAYDPDDEMCEKSEGSEWCVWTLDEDAPDNLKIKPGWGYWVMVTDKPELCDTEGRRGRRCFWREEDPLWMIIGGSLFSPATTPPSRNLQKGWNLIGYYGTSWELYPLDDANFVCGDAFQMPDRYIYGDKVYCSLNSLIDTQEGYPRWSSVWSFVNCGNHHTAWMGLNTCADPDSPIQSMLDRMYAGRGYWLELDVPDIYAPATTCLWNSDFECRWTGGGIFP
jgi:hypothetical protein